MKNNRLEIKNITTKDRDLVGKVSKNSQIKLYLKNHSEIANDFHGKRQLYSYWICSSKDKPVALMITQDISKTSAEHFMPWIAPERETRWLGLVSLHEEPQPETVVEWLKLFVSAQPATIGAVLADPEMKEESLITSYEQAGFTKVGSFIKGQGFFKGTAHVLMYIQTQK